MIVRSLAYLFFFIASTLAYGQLGFSLADGRSKVQIPVEIHDNLIVVPVVLNHSLPLKFILDTGVRTTILTQKNFADILNLPYWRKYSISGPGGKKIVNAYVVTNVSLNLPGVSGEGQAMVVLEEDYIELRNFLGTDVHGILGYELFSRFIVKIDYAGKTMTLIKSGKFKPKKKFHKIQGSVEDTKFYINLPVKTNDSTEINAKLLVDTGASHGLLLYPEADTLLLRNKNYLSTIIGRGLGGDITGKVCRVSKLTFGNHVLENVLTNVPDPNSYHDSLRLNFAFSHGSLGGEILNRFTVILDFPRQLMYIKKNASFNREFYLNLSGIQLKAIGAHLNRFEITEIRKDSPAELAGAEVGDLVVSVNGVHSSQFRLGELYAVFNSKPGRKVRVELQRDNAIKKIEIRLLKQF